MGIKTKIRTLHLREKKSVSEIAEVPVEFRLPDGRSHAAMDG